MGKAGACRIPTGIGMPGRIAVHSAAKFPHWCAAPNPDPLPVGLVAFPA